LTPLLAALAVDRLLKNSDFLDKNKKKVYIGLGIVVGFCFLMLVAPSMFTSFYTQTEYDQVAASVKSQKVSQDILDSFFAAIESARKTIYMQDVTRSFLLILVASVLIWAYTRFRFKREYLV